ncbi:MULTISPECIES: DUF4232 domain-containing protein [unclassified Streptomyces]|uniref:DUF4232 domain-containing protein n=1 Tax=unclassified Streptomyces TaxID=2593676 RepID=UPI00382F1DA5
MDAAPDEESGRIDITMINRGSATCSATGFAGVDIKDADNTSNPIERGHAQPRITTLKPGDAAVFNLSYDIDNTGNSLASPTNILVTPPNETHAVSLEWPAARGTSRTPTPTSRSTPHTHTTDQGWRPRAAPGGGPAEGSPARTARQVPRRSTRRPPPASEPPGHFRSRGRPRRDGYRRRGGDRAGLGAPLRPWSRSR